MTGPHTAPANHRGNTHAPTAAATQPRRQAPGRHPYEQPPADPRAAEPPCVGRAELFTHSKRTNTPRVHAAQALCARCPIAAACLTDARARHEWGIWGGQMLSGPPAGTFPRGRRRAACGTLAAYRRHRDAGEPACEPCHAALLADRRQKDRDARRRKDYAA